MAAPRKPQDHNVKAAVAEANGELFEFTGLDGETYAIPRFTLSGIPTINGGVLRKNRNNQQELIFLALEYLASDEALAALDAFEPAALGHTIEEWQRHSGATAPQS